MSLTSKVAPYMKGFGPLATDIHRIPFHSACHLGECDQAKANKISLIALKKAFKDTFDPDSIAAIIYEPVQGEGGFCHTDQEFYQELSDITKPLGILTIVNEVQSDFGRTEKLFASEYFQIDYDIITMAKSIASSMPISAITGRSDIMDAPQVGGLGNTYDGKPLACAAALAIIDALDDEMLSRGRIIGEKIYAAFKRFQKDSPYIDDVRGVGAMVAFEMVKTKTLIKLQPNSQPNYPPTAERTNCHLSLPVPTQTGKNPSALCDQR